MFSFEPKKNAPEQTNLVTANFAELLKFENVSQIDFKIVGNSIDPKSEVLTNLDYKNALLNELAYHKNKYPFLKEEFFENPEAAHNLLVDNFLGQPGIRKISFDSNKIDLDLCVVPYPAFATFNSSENQSLRNFAANLGVSLLIATSDNMLVLQTRSELNRFYAGTIGLSVAGFIDAKLLQTSSSNNLMTIALEQLLEEGQEEIGFLPSAIDKYKFVGISTDKKAYHHDLSFYTNSKLSSEEVIAGFQKLKLNDSANNPHSFSEQIVLLPATEKTFKKLFFEANSPIPPTHLACLASYYVDNFSKNAVDKQTELRNLFLRLDEAYDRIDRLCDYQKYQPGKSIVKQGLPSAKRMLRDF